jgi:gliding motility-associated lipoprotein GldH
MNKFILLGFILLAFTGCQLNHVFEKNIEVPDYKWDYKFIPQFKVEITDTISSYNMYVNIRHLEAYQYMNIWILMHVSSPDGKQQTERITLPLAQSDGKWLGEGLNGVWMLGSLAKRQFKFPHKGEYTFSIEHDMRINPLTEIMDVGLRLEKLEKK